MTDGLELDGADHERLAERTLGYTAAYLDDLAAAPASWPPIAPELATALGRPPDETATDLDDLFGTLDEALATGINTSSGKFLSYIPSGGLYSAALGRMIAATVNRYTGGTHGAPGLIAMEHGVVRWMCSLFDMPPSSSGVLLSGGSIANLTATVAARSRLGADFGAGVVYTSERAHHSVAKAVRIAGINPERLRLIPTDGNLRIDTRLLSETIAADESAGLVPMLIAVSAGTTDTGTIDPLAECAAITKASGAWLHVDAAYGGFFALTERGKTRLAGIELADSITVDAHKSLFMPFGVGGLLVRDERTLIDAHEGQGAYMQDVPAHVAAIPNYFAMGPELTRPARGLELWLALRVHGVAAFRNELDRMLDLAAWSAAELGAIDGVTVAAPPELSIVAFRAAAGNDASRAIAEALNGSRRVHVSSTTIGDEFMVRLAFLSQRTSRDVAREAVSLVRQTVAATS